jgi:hypothetical protein
MSRDHQLLLLTTGIFAVGTAAVFWIPALGLPALIAVIWMHLESVTAGE